MMKLSLSIEEVFQFIQAIDGHTVLDSEKDDEEFLDTKEPQTRGQSEKILKSVREQLFAPKIEVSFAAADQRLLASLLKSHADWLRDYMEGGSTRGDIKISSRIAKKIKALK